MAPQDQAQGEAVLLDKVWGRLMPADVGTESLQELEDGWWTAKRNEEKIGPTLRHAVGQYDKTNETLRAAERLLRPYHLLGPVFCAL